MKRCYLKPYKKYKLNFLNEYKLFVLKNLKKDRIFKIMGISYSILLTKFCILTGRSHSIHGLFKTARMELKHLMSKGLLHGVRKSS